MLAWLNPLTWLKLFSMLKTIIGAVMAVYQAFVDWQFKSKTDKKMKEKAKKLNEAKTKEEIDAAADDLLSDI